RRRSQGWGLDSSGRAPLQGGLREGSFKPVDGFANSRSRTSKIDPHESPAFGAELRSTIQPQPGLREHEVIQLGRRKSEPAAIHPCKVERFRRKNLNLVGDSGHFPRKIGMIS